MSSTESYLEIPEAHMSPPGKAGKDKPRTPMGTILGILAKSAKLLKVFKTVKVLQPLLSFGSMIVSVFVYSFSMGLWFAVGFVIMLFIHELGHATVLRHKGMKASLPMFIPFIGAAIFAPDMGKRNDEAQMAIAGPLTGGIFAILLFGVTMLIPGHHPLLLALSSTAILINLFNLIPVRPLDGGRVGQAVGPAFKYIGIAALLGLTLYVMNPGLLLIWVLVLSDLRMKPWLKFTAGVCLEILAVALMSAGFGEHQAFWISTIDVTGMTIFNFIYWWEWKKRETLPRDSADNRPQLSPRARWGWFAALAALAAALLAMSVIVHGQLAVYIPG